MKHVTIYTLNYCPYCKRAKTILREKNISFEEIDVTENEETKTKEIAEKYNIKNDVTFPQIIIGEQRIGGCSDLEQLILDGKFDDLMKEE